VSSVFPWQTFISFLATEKRNYTEFSPFFFRAFCVSVANLYFFIATQKWNYTELYSLLFPCLLRFRAFCVSVATFIYFLDTENRIYTEVLFPYFSAPSAFPWQNFIPFLATSNRIYTELSTFFFRVFCISVANFYFLPGTCLINQFTKSFVALKFSNSAGNFLPSIYSL